MGETEVLRVLRAFQQAGVEYVMIGATAMGFHGLVRATEDVDMLVRPDTGNVRRIRSALLAVFPEDPAVQEIRDGDLLGDYAVVRYCPPDAEYYYDFIAGPGEGAHFESVESEIKHFEGTRVRVATPEALYRLKKDTDRPIDALDATVLCQSFQLEEER